MVSSMVFLTEVPHHACALNIHICPTSTTMGSPGSFPGTLQFPGTPGEANESAPDRKLVPRRIDTARQTFIVSPIYRGLSIELPLINVQKQKYGILSCTVITGEINEVFYILTLMSKHIGLFFHTFFAYWYIIMLSSHMNFICH